MAGLIDLICTDYFKQEDDVVFIHTGGTVGLFAYRDIFSRCKFCMRRMTLVPAFDRRVYNPIVLALKQAERYHLVCSLTDEG